MKWERGHQSSDVEDNRGRSLAGGAGMLGPALAIGSRFGLPGIVIALLAVFVLPRFMGGGGQSLAPEQAAGEARPVADEQVQFVSFVFDDAQRSWTELLASGPQPYRKAKLVLFTDRTSSGCGSASSAVGPFYCPPDQKVYIDLSFYQELSRRFGAPGDFAQAYVIAHEVGHHVQNLLGIERRVRSSGGPREGQDSNAVKLELQADCFAGLWGRSLYEQGVLEDGDLEEGITAAEAVGDDRIQEKTQGRVDPESFTHGTSEQRRSWFRKGYDSGDISECDTFSVDEL
jgi:predicted metalloprotease